MLRSPARFREWLERVPVEDALERRHAVVLQVFALVFFCSVLVVEGLRWSAGAHLRSPAASLVNLVDVAISGVAVWWIRRGKYRRAARLFVIGYSVVLATAISIGGLAFGRDGMRALAVALALAALLLGRRALWSVLFTFLVALAVALARDQGMLGGEGPHPSAASPVTIFWASAFGFCVLAIVLDRFGLTVLEAFSDAMARQRQLEATTAELRATNEALAAEVRERQRVEEQLRDSEELFRVAFQTSPYAISINRLDDGVFLAVNRGFTELSGFAESEVVGRTLTEEGLWVDPSVQAEAAERIRRDGALREMEARFRRKDGSELVGRFSAQRFEVAGLPHVLAVTRDVSAARAAEGEKRRLQAQLVHAQRMEAVGTLAAGIAHDFNNILSIVMSYAALAQQGLPAGSPVRDDLGQITGASQRAAGLVRQLLAFASRQPGQPEAVDVAALVVECQRLLRRVLPSDIGLRAALSPDLPRVLVDRSQLEQVVMNLSVNARDAMPRGGTIEISVFGEDSHVVLTVRDTGSGIPRELQDKIFEPFFTTKEPGKGTGLGLATCYGIVRQAGGHIEVESEPGLGTLFRVRLPALAEGQAVPGAPARAEPPPTAPRGGETVLLAEDDSQVREATARMLRSLGYRVLAAPDASAALALAREQRGAIDLLVADLVMPGMRGPDLARTLRAELPRARTLFISGYADAALLGSARQEGAPLLGKPFTLESLAASVRKVLDG